MNVRTSGLLAVLCAGAAFGNTVTTFSTWTAADGLATYSANGTTLSANIGTLSIGSSGAGINGGILDYSHSEINQIEVLTLSFLDPQTVTALGFAKLVANEGVPPFTYNEKGDYRVNGGSWVTFTAANSNGNLSLNVLLPGVTTLDFRPSNPSAINVLYDYTLANVTTTPEPGTGMLVSSLLALGLPLIYAKRRKRNA